MKKFIAIVTLAAFVATPVAAQSVPAPVVTSKNYDVVDPSSTEGTRLQPATPAQVMFPNTADVAPDQRAQPIKDPDKPAPEFWYLAVPAVLFIVGSMIFGPKPKKVPDAGQPMVNPL